MSFANPLAWFGLAALAVPIAVHLLARHRGPRTVFPTLRFFVVDRLVAVRRYQLTDLWLMAVRIAAVACAVFALAGPRLSWWAASFAPAQPALAIVVDTSQSMSRPGRDGRPAIEAARSEAARLSRSSNRTTVVDASGAPSGVGAFDPGTAVAGAVAWLETQTNPRELIVISDFQRGALSEADLRRVPQPIGVRLIPIDIAASPSVAGPAIWRNDANEKLREYTPRITASADQTGVTWLAGPDLATERSPSFDLDPMLAFVASAADAPRALSALRAVMGQGSHSGSRERPVAMVFPGAPGHGGLWDHATPLDRPWMVDVVRHLSLDDAVRDAARHARATAQADMRDGLVIVAQDDRGMPLIVAASGEAGGAHRLLLFVEGDASSLASALVMEDALRATSGDAPMSELEPIAIDADTLHRWERQPTSAPVDEPRPSDPAGRWVWVVVLMWLGVETWLRRERRADDGRTAAAGHEVSRDRVA